MKKSVPPLIVVDASILANVIGDDGADGQRARSEVRSAGALAAPDLVDVGTVALLRKRWIAGATSDDRFAEAIDDSKPSSWTATRRCL